MSRNGRNRNRRERMKAARANDGRRESCEHGTLAAIQQYFESRGLSFCGNPEEGYLALELIFYPPEAVTYRNADGDAACKVIFTASEDGQSVLIDGQAAWNLRDCSHRAAVYEMLIRSPLEMPIVRFLHDPESDSVIPFSIVSVGNRGVSEDLIKDGLFRVVHAIPRWDPVIRRAMETGEVSVPSLPGSEEEPSPDEVQRIRRGLINRLAEEVKAGWQQVRQVIVAKAGENGFVSMSEELRSNCLLGTAAIVHGGRLLDLTPTLPVKFESIVASANSQLAAMLDC